MENQDMNDTKEMLDTISIEDIADLKVEVDDLMAKLDNIIETCDTAINS